MQKLALVGVGLLSLGVVSVVVWREATAGRHFASDLQAQMVEENTSSRSAQAELPQRSAEARAVKVVNLQDPAPKPDSPAVSSTSTSQPAGTPSENPPKSESYYLPSDSVARARVNAWVASLATGGQPLIKAQEDVLTAAAIAEMRRETDDSAKLALHGGSADPGAVARAKEELVKRQHDTHLRILDDVRPNLTAQQVEALRTIFDNWYAGAQVTARIARERAAQTTP